MVRGNFFWDVEKRMMVPIPKGYVFDPSREAYVPPPYSILGEVEGLLGKEIPSFTEADADSLGRFLKEPKEKKEIKERLDEWKKREREEELERRRKWLN